ncbi:MAG: helix-turn-helix domain-containing protein, partial [Actinomycetota bacterium]|nr:helix-turn-helix domain-containing protein [Actinomycetota bacterium]
MPAVTDRTEKIPHPPPSALDLATIMRTLGDPARLEIVRLLADGRPRLCGELATALEMPTSTGSYHLRLLREAGITHSRAHGTSATSRCAATISRSGFPGSSGSSPADSPVLLHESTRKTEAAGRYLDRDRRIVRMPEQLRQHRRPLDPAARGTP